MTPRRILVTSALPYANGPIHMGHLVEYIQTDIWVRFQRMLGHDVAYLCADDTHGTSIMMRARREGRSEEALLAETNAAHQRDFAKFAVSFDHYGSTNSEANRRLCHEFWQAFRNKGLVAEREVSQLFDPTAGVFLADRFVKGTCPKCASPNQNGDSCDVCGSTYSPTDLKDPVSTLSGATPEIRSATHLFVNIESERAFLEEWTQGGDHLHPSIANYLKGHFLTEALRDWDVSRPAPYFGFEIPDAPGHFWYVWFDAPIGYLAATLEWCEKTSRNFADWWKSDATEVYHFIGKDITYFHTLFWPVMLKVAGFTLPKRVQIHGFLTVNGEKMSKSKGTYITAETFAQHVDPQSLRYYYASKLGVRPDDLDLDLEEFTRKVNGELVNKVVNLASRSAKFLETTGLSAQYPDDEGLFAKAAAAGDEIAAAYDGWEYNKAQRLIMALADAANEYFDRKEPWKLRKDPARAQDVQDICTVAINLYRQLAIYLSPVLPQLACDSAELLNAPLAAWAEAKQAQVGAQLRPYKHLMQRLDVAAVQKVIESSVVAPDGQAAPAPAASSADDDAAFAAEPLAAECSIDDFAKVDLRVARVLSAEAVEGSDKLLKLSVSLGGAHRRQIFAGIKSAYEPAALVGKLVVIVANLKPRKMKFGMSEGMVIAAGPGGKEVFVLSPDSGAKPGQRVH
ncbi:MAG: methionine--tRNA ligase [Deltaproteobacteria bacterium]|nr:methionine--tRNA ligase [Deltaproteobacteria bacterium]